ncbi:MAG: cytochrome c biogenesis protein ResB, partial [Candidatus Nanopelagicales bacterium]
MTENNIQIKLGFSGWLRWIWRQLTSMTTALWLLLLLGLAAIPGSILPQRSASLIRVNDFKEANPTLFEIYDQLGLFEVYGSFWFSAIYILLMISLAGCIVPRIKIHAKNLTEPIQEAPINLVNQTGYQAIETSLDLAKINKLAQKNWWRTKISADGNSLTIEKGYLRESGNLLFHIAILFITIAVAFGALFNYRGTILLIEKDEFANT